MWWRWFVLIFVYICVVDRFVCLRSFWIVFKFFLVFNKWVVKECCNVWGVVVVGNFNWYLMVFICCWMWCGDSFLLWVFMKSGLFFVMG